MNVTVHRAKGEREELTHVLLSTPQMPPYPGVSQVMEVSNVVES